MSSIGGGSNDPSDLVQGSEGVTLKPQENTVIGLINSNNNGFRLDDDFCEVDISIVSSHPIEADSFAGNGITVGNATGSVVTVGTTLALMGQLWINTDGGAGTYGSDPATGSIVGHIKIYSETGTLLGYLPLYDSV